MAIVQKLTYWENLLVTSLRIILPVNIRLLSVLEGNVIIHFFLAVFQRSVFEFSHTSRMQRAPSPGSEHAQNVL